MQQTIRDYMEVHSCGLLEAKAAVLRANKLERLCSLKTLAELSAQYLLANLIDELIADLN